VTRQNLIVASLIADALDIAVVGQWPGLSWLIDLPLIALHVWYAGPAGLPTLLELVPVVGTLPLFTVAAFSHVRSH
jgi:hypothetical protein